MFQNMSLHSGAIAKTTVQFESLKKRFASFKGKLHVKLQADLNPFMAEKHSGLSRDVERRDIHGACEALQIILSF